MKKTLIALAISLATATIAINGQIQHPKNPLVAGAQTMAGDDQPIPCCPPLCSDGTPSR